MKKIVRKKTKKTSKKTLLSKFPINFSNPVLLLALFVAITVAVFLSTKLFQSNSLKTNKLNTANSTKTGNKLYDETSEKVLPSKGYRSRIKLADSILKLSREGVIDKQKFIDLYKEREGFPQDLKEVLDKPSNKRIVLTKDNANFYVNLLWPVGLSNYMSANKESQINEDVDSFASTGGWSLGRESGGVYFNKFKIVELTPEQEALVTKLAKNIYRPCCDNSTFFQDCNHGSALLGVLQLGASQGLSEDQLYEEALAFNSFWFPDNYVKTALYFKIEKKTDWEDVDPREVLGKNFSAISGWLKNVEEPIAKIPNLIPKQEGGGSCGT